MNVNSFDNTVEDGGDDPVLRCDSCNRLVKRTTLHQLGACGKCGNKRVRNINNMTDKDRKKIKKWGFDKFLEKFEAVPNE